jgi:hypothetical protein
MVKTCNTVYVRYWYVIKILESFGRPQYIGAAPQLFIKLGESDHRRILNHFLSEYFQFGSTF